MKKPVENQKQLQSFLRNSDLGTASFFAVLALSFNAFAQDFSASATMKSLVIDQGVDFSHSQLKNNVNFNSIEQNGKSGVDDDKNSFVDDIAGWNSVSNDGVYFPAHVLEKFTRNTTQVQKLLDLYTAVENGDAQARRTIGSNPSLIQQISELLEYSHGTHVGGLVNKGALGTARLQSVNVFEGSKPQGDNSENPIEGMNRKAFSNALRMLDNLPEEIAANTTTPLDVVPAARESFLDDTQGIKDFIVQMDQQNAAEYSAMSKYLQASQSKVANLSLGVAKKNIRDRLDQMWQEELAQAGLPENTAMTAAQESNYHLLIDGIYDSSARGWGTLFALNPDVLFVIAAGNDGEAELPDAGNIDLNPVTPADQSAVYPNVLTVAATDQEGVITDFSCFSPSKVNVGAWGKAVPSLAPGEHTVAMSGTSMASPLVAGLATKVRSINPKLSAVQTRKLIENTVRKVASLSGKVSTGGMIDSQAAVLAAQNSLNNPFHIALEKSLSSRSFERNGRATTILNIDGSVLVLDLDMTREGQVSETPDLVKSIMKTAGLF